MSINRIFLISAVLSFMLAWQPAVAKAAPGDGGAAGDLKAVVATLEQGYRQLRDLQAEFSQKTTLSALKRTEKGSGELMMKMPETGAAMFRFDYRKPKQQIVSDGRQVWFYIPENKQVMVSDVKRMMAQGGVALNYLTGLGNVSRDFKISIPGTGRDAKGNYLIDLVPKKGGQAFARLQLTVAAAAVEKFRKNGEAEDPFPIVSSVVYDQIGTSTAIDYSRVKVNQGLGAGKFTFKVPKGVEIIKP